jgi:glucose/arabinose dehydrogenase
MRRGLLGFWNRPSRSRARRRSSIGAPRRPIRLDLQALEERRVLATTLPAGFVETLITTASNLSGPTAIEFSPTGQLWVLEQSGAVKMVHDDGTTHTALTLTVDSSGERGLLGIAFDPSYNGDGVDDFVYLYYTVPRANPSDPSNNLIRRFSASGGTSPMLSATSVIRELPPENEDGNLATDGDDNHNGGAIHFGIDGKLYVAVGDHNYDPADQEDHPSQNTDTPFGKILRLNPDLSNPTDTPNPFFTGSTSDWQGAIWALGLRNPFTFAVEPGTGKIFINDVGESIYEEINEGAAGANYGWAGSVSPLWEGFEPNPAMPPVPWANYHNPQMAYRHDSTSPGSTAIAGGAFYPAGGPFGSAYEGLYFYADLGGRYIRIFDPDDPGSLSDQDTSTGFASNLTTSLPVDLKVNSQGDLFYVARGGTGEIYRIAASRVVGRHLFYNQSAFDGDNASINANDDNAIAPDKSAYLPGAGLATFNNISSYSRGINGIAIDLLSGGAHASINANDFVFKVGNNNSPSTWSTAPAPSAISVRVGAGLSGSDRVEITWAAGAVKNTWLEVQVLPTSRTGLTATDVFFWGNRAGDTTSPASGVAFVTNVAGDGAAIVGASPGIDVGITNAFDINRTNTVNVAGDRAEVVGNSPGTLLRISISAGGPFTPQSGDTASHDRLSGGQESGDAGIASALASPQTKLPAETSPRLAVRALRPSRHDPPLSRIVTFFAQLGDEWTGSPRWLAEADGLDELVGLDGELLAALSRATSRGL